MLRVGVQLPQARVAERGDRVEDPLALSRTAIAVEKGLNLALRLSPGDDAWLATAGADAPLAAKALSMPAVARAT